MKKESLDNIVYQSKKLRKERKKLAVFDVDWTLIRPKEGRRFPKDKNDWQWLYDSVPSVLKKHYRKDYQIVFLTDQTKAWKVDMIKDIIHELDIPVTAIIAMKKEDHKPNPSLFQTVFQNKEYKKEESFYVGDAAGREGDWAGKDKEVAEKIGLPFYTPEEMFFVIPKEEKKQLPNLVRTEKEVVIMIGYPGSGKSTIAKEVFEKNGYVRIDGDALKTTPKMLKEAEKHITTSSIVFDATNGTKEKRAFFIEFAKKHQVPVKCVWKATTIDESMKQNLHRAAQGGPKVPDVVFYVYRKKFEEPTHTECEVIKID